MAERIWRVEKTDGAAKKVFYIELQREARNSVTRLWNTFGTTGLSVSKREKESFQNPGDVETYAKNAKAQYLKQGYKDVLPAPAKDEITLE